MATTEHINRVESRDRHGSIVSRSGEDVVAADEERHFTDEEGATEYTRRRRQGGVSFGSFRTTRTRSRRSGRVSFTLAPCALCRRIMRPACCRVVSPVEHLTESNEVEEESNNSNKELVVSNEDLRSAGPKRGSAVSTSSQSQLERSSSSRRGSREGRDVPTEQASMSPIAEENPAETESYDLEIRIESANGSSSANGEGEKLSSEESFKRLDLSPVLLRGQSIAALMNPLRRMSRHQSERQALGVLDDPDSNVHDIIEAMQSQPNSSIVQEKGCAILTSLAKERCNQAEISDAGGIYVVLDAMKGHPDHPNVQGHCCAALGNLAAFDNVNKITIATEGGIPLIIDAMNQHVNVAVLQEKAIGAMFNLAFHHKNKGEIADCGGIRAIVRAMDVHRNEAGVQQNACSALWNLAGHPRNAAVIADRSGIESIVHGMRTHPDHAQVQHAGSGALRSLGVRGENKVRIAETGGVPVLIAAMEGHPDDGSVQQEACGALRNLSQHPKVRTTIRDQGPHCVLESAADRFPRQCGDNAETLLDKL